MLCDGEEDLWDSVEGNMRLRGSHVHHRPCENNAGNGIEYDLERRARSVVLPTKI